MILPIYLYGNPVLTTPTLEVDPMDPAVLGLIHDMFETMYAASGVGLAAPQIGRGIKLFVMDAAGFDPKRFSEEKRVFVNPVIIQEEGEPWLFNEGCLSIPDVRGDVMRKPRIQVAWTDQDGKRQLQWFDDMPARIIQHEYDHLMGKLFVGYFSPLRRQMIQRRLESIRKGMTKVDYPVFAALPQGGRNKR
ncbi:MAG: peptide deformylase [Sphingomonadales bacterium]|nr:peptide deformylase [Sphingomonadales bacterium]